ncbi:MAG: peptidoglycan DD-metalloendopeptidase family protein [Alphaproteobacteria bacterium]|nr:peptidoglycan DD-metalloendopeptidase family protein [Alphaproteobacteria bacterium]
MNVAQKAFVLFALFAVAACGNHGKHAAALYGPDAPQAARIYKSPKDIYRKQEVEEVRRTASVTAQGRPVALTPVSAIYLSDTPPAAAPEKVKGYIEVQPRDSVYVIARRFNVSPKAIISANDLRAPYALRVGQALKLPKGATVATAPAPIRQVVARDMLYTARKGDTLYSISKASNVPVKEIAKANRMRAPYRLSIGQKILVPQARENSAIYANAAQSRKTKKSAKIANRRAAPRDVADIARNVSYTQPAPINANNLFDWPVRGNVIADYRSGGIGRRNDGVNIAAPAGTPVRAAADGQVVYRGSGLDGFGNLLLVRHVDGYVTAYAHNDAMLVKKGDTVRQGQMIAKVGSTGSVSSPQLHFEIRQNLKSIDPATMLGKQ